MKIIQVNAWKGFLYQQIVRLIEAEQPDIICLQELHSAEHAPGDLWPFQSLQYFQKASGLEYTYYSPTYDFEAFGVTVEHGNGILSRYPLEHAQTIFTNGEHIHAVAETLDSNVRNVQIVTVDSPEGPFTLVNHHGHWEKDPLGSPTSVEKMRMITAQLESIQGPLLIAGDLNINYHSEALRVLCEEAHVRSLTQERQIVSTLSGLGQPFDVPCDHILVNDGLEVTSFEISEKIVSDHKALIAEFSFSKSS